MPVSRADLAEETFRLNIPLTAWCAADMDHLNVADTEDAGDHFLSLATNTLALTGNTPSSDTQTDVSHIQVALPANYKPGTAITFAVSAEVDATADANTVDLTAFEVNTTTGAVSSDLCSTGVINTTTTATQHEFTIGGGALEPGSLLNLNLTTANQDADGTDGVVSIWGTALIMTVRG